MFETTGLASKALSAADAVAPILGTLTAWLAPAGEGDMSSKLNFYVDALKGFKIADPIKTTQLALAEPDRYPIGQGISLALLGWGIREVGQAIGKGVVSRMGGIALKGGSAIAVNSLVASYIFEARNNPHSAASIGSSGYGAGSKNTIAMDNPQLLAPARFAAPVAEGWSGSL